MVALGSLWLPILLSSVLVWIASALVWTVMPHHKSDWKPVSDEAAARSALKNHPPGQYSIPYAATQAAMKDPDFVRKTEEGPNAYVTVVPSGQIAMGGKMAGSFVYNLAVGVVVAYLASRTVSAGAEYLTVFRVTGTTAWLAYSFAIIPDAIWFGRPWSTTTKTMLDGLAYALLTAGTFGWLWPGA